MPRGIKIPQQLPPGLKTRSGNKTTHPAAAAGLVPKPRASREEAQEKRDQLAREKKEKDAAAVEAQLRAAEVEDTLRREDLDRELMANHPPHSGASMFKPPANTAVRSTAKELAAVSSHTHDTTPGYESGDSGINSGKEYVPPPAPDGDSDSDIESEDSDDEDNTILGLVGREKQMIASDVEPTSNKSKKKKNSTSGKAAFDAKWLETSKARGAKAIAAAAAAIQDDDSLVKMGGFVVDDENDEIEKKAVRNVGAGPAAKKAPMAIVKVVPNKHVVTMTELRGGSRKWNLTHLPLDTSTKFMNEVVPLAKEKVGTLAPWANLSSAELQKIIDMVYGVGAYTVQGGDVWNGLISYRLQSWRNGFATAAINVVESYFDDPDNRDILSTPENRRKAVDWFLDWQGKEGQETAPYQWKQCVDRSDGSRRKRGFCEAPFIVHTFAVAHLSFVTPPDLEDPESELPVGALILSLQAVEHALKEYQKDGTR
ncbi:hypothetical protein DXG01_016962 [Tephrocybe rancida]|nr:hypothetical protein DXG01_016962 [Tephrocybe rancida]